MKPNAWFKFTLPSSLILLLILCGNSRHCCHAFEFSPLTPISWMWSGVKTAASGVKTAASGVKSAASGVKTVVTGAAGLTQSAYRLVKSTEAPTVDGGGGGAPEEAPKSGHTPVGCFEDVPDKTPKLFQKGGSGRQMNKAKCSSKCDPFETELFGIRSSPTEKGILECWCGHSFQRLPAATDFDCDNRCPEEEDQSSRERCGGDGFMSVYERAS